MLQGLERFSKVMTKLQINRNPRIGTEMINQKLLLYDMGQKKNVEELMNDV
jgi:uncharacterized protein YneF (UPF0154 family)